MYYVYRFLDEKKNIIYVGKSKQNLEQRFRNHLHLPEDCYNLTHIIEYIECTTESDMTIKEIYYINKYRHDGTFFNLLDTMDAPVSIAFNDEWQQYMGPLGPHFHNSINYIKGYTSKKETRFNKDGSIDRRKSNSVQGVSVYVDALSAKEVDLIVEYLISEINCAENKNQEEIRFRNLAAFILSVNLPHKSNDLLCFKYCDLFDENNCLKAVDMRLNRAYMDEIIRIPLRGVASQVLSAYTRYLGYTYNDNSLSALFQTREHKIMSSRTWWRILNDAAASVGIKKNIGSESLRKTYGLNIFKCAADQIKALMFLEKIWGSVRYGNIITYLNVADDCVDYDYYFGESFALGNIDLSKIKCLQPRISVALPTKRANYFPRINKQNSTWTTQKKTTQEPAKKTIKVPEKKAKTNKLWPKEKKLEVVLKYLDQHIPQKDLAKQYGVDSAYISRWVCAYKRYGASVFEDKRFKQK